MHAGWALEHPGDVLEQLEPAVERAAADQLERDVGISVVDAVVARAPGDDREDDHAEAVDQTRFEE